MESDTEIRDALLSAKVIACVGASAKEVRPSHYVSLYLMEQGKRVIGVNPGLAGQKLFGEPVYANLKDIPEDIDFIDVFRRSDLVLPMVKDALESLPALRTIWMQLGVQNDEAAALARAQGVTVIQNRCPKIEWPRLIG
ncbi:MAG: CoA-binding protein [Pseudoruegeria sp.]